ncbi:MAG: primosomal protein N' [Bdellovibrionales bacterium]|jgi:primosomal protein N' (replication factor Y)|nr:primosomal protein N' [Bdellovibrionales bacterium]
MIEEHDNALLVAANTPFNNSLLTYLGKGQRGDLVEVPLGNRVVPGLVLDDNASLEDLDKNKIKNIKGPLTEKIKIHDRDLELYQWMASYYHYPLGQLVYDSLPKILKRPRELKFTQGEGKDFNFTLNDDQQSIFESMKSCLYDGFSKHLLHGVTGSGKSFIYLSLFKEVLKSGKSVLFLLPEINLTKQFVNLFSQYLDVAIYLYHSDISNSDKFCLWEKVQDLSTPVLIIGVRSSLFLPLNNLGLIVVDEEHDASFKQDDRCTYNARDVAVKKASLQKVPIVLGSATPSLETLNSFQSGQGHYHILNKRMGNSTLPTLELVDERGEKREEEIWPLTDKTVDEIQEALDRKEQVIVFINRLGFSNYLMCRNCGHKFVCPNCTLSLRYYKKKDILKCQICELKTHKPSECPDCGNMKLLNRGFGTERIQDILQKKFPERVIERFDRDEITNFNKLEKSLDKFNAGETDIFVGTQMISKGHNFENVKLVVILGLDGQLNFADFRAYEKTFQMLTQVSGRAGRFGGEGKVLIQTCDVENPLFNLVREQKFEEFYTNENQLRQDLSLPPHSRMAIIYLTGRFQDKVEADSEKAVFILKNLVQKSFSQVSVEGPRPAIIEKKVNKYTWAILLRSQNLNQLHNCLKSLTNNLKMHHSVTLKLDIDPQTIG